MKYILDNLYQSQAMAIHLAWWTNKWGLFRKCEHAVWHITVINMPSEEMTRED